MRTLFATHYHELTALEELLPGVKNFNVDVREHEGNIVFLHKIVAGSTSKSYGVHVAKLAGVPQVVLHRAEDKLAELEISVIQPSISNYGGAPVAEAKASEKQLSFFDFIPNPVLERLKALNLMELTPSQAFSILEELKHAAEE